MPDRSESLSQLGARLLRLRRNHGLSVEELAARAGIAKGNLSEIERGLRDPRYSTLVSVAGALQVTLAELLSVEAVPPR